MSRDLQAETWVCLLKLAHLSFRASWPDNCKQNRLEPGQQQQPLSLESGLGWAQEQAPGPRVRDGSSHIQNSYSSGLEPFCITVGKACSLAEDFHLHPKNPLGIHTVLGREAGEKEPLTLPSRPLGEQTGSASSDADQHTAALIQGQGSAGCF